MFSALGWQRRSGKDRAVELLEEIATLENRLQIMGVDGDCAYERAISRLYQLMVEERKQQLADLRVSSFQARTPVDR